MRILAVMRHDDGLARRLQSPIGKAANEIRRRYALWFLCRRHAPPPIYRDLPTIVGLAGMIWRAIMSATAPLCAGSDQPRLAAAQRVDPDRKSVVDGKSVSVRVDIGGRRIIKKQKIRIENSKTQER